MLVKWTELLSTGLYIVKHMASAVRWQVNLSFILTKSTRDAHIIQAPETCTCIDFFFSNEKLVSLRLMGNNDWQTALIKG